MSRCFPYPPPGYEKKVTHDEALIESIKLQRKEEKTKRDRKKEKKREKKEKEKARKDENFENKKHKHKRGHNDESREDEKGDYQKKIKNGTEHLERSTVTEEQGHHPVGSQNSLDSTLKSNKRLKQSSPHDSNHNFGSVFRIRMPSQRHKDPEVLPSKKQASPASGKDDGISARGMRESPHKASREQWERSCSTSRNVGKSIAVSVSKEMNRPPSFGVHCKAEASIQKLCGICPPALASKLRDLVEDWIPQPVQPELADSCDQDWLSVSNQHVYRGHKRYTGCSDDTSVGNSTAWPRACYLPEADIYALPFTVPF